MPENENATDGPYPREREYPVGEELRAELRNRFTYHALHPDQIPRYGEIRELAHGLAVLIAFCTPPSREQALALTKLEEAVMHANSAIAREPRKDSTLASVVAEAKAWSDGPTAIEQADAARKPTPPSDLAPIGG